MAQPSVEANAVFSHWHHPIANFSTSAQEFYGCVERTIATHQMPDVQISRVEWKEGGSLSANRLYLRVKRGSLVFDICAAPFGADYFFSWWLAEVPPRYGLLRLAGILFGLLFAFGLLTGVISTILGGVAGVVLGIPFGFVALVVLVVVLGWAVSTGTFGPGAEDALVATPFFGWVYVKLFGPFTYYKMDTKLMFQSAVHAAVLEVVDQITSAKGIRALSELERKPILREFYRR